MMYSPNKLNTIRVILLALTQTLVFLILPITSQPSFTSVVCQDIFGNYTTNSTFKTNLDTLISTITSDTKIDYNFYNFSVGQDSDVVNGIGLCMKDILLDDCHRCLAQATTALVQACPNQKDAIGWYPTCMLRYSNRYIFRKMEITPWFHLQDNSHFSDKGKFNQTATAKLQKRAAAGDSRGKYAAGKAKVTRSYTIYAYAQCTPDLDYSDCYNCLDQAINFALFDLFGQTIRVFFTSCQIRMEDYHVYNATYLNSLGSTDPLDRPPPSPASAFLPPHAVKTNNGKFLILLLSVFI